MKCLRCNKEIPNDSIYCNYCGIKQESLLKEQNIAAMVDEIEAILSVTHSCFSEIGRALCEQQIKEFGFDIVLESAKISLAQYLRYDDKGQPTDDSVSKVFKMIGGIAKNKYDSIHKPYLSDVKRIMNYAKKAFYLNWYNERDLNADLNNILYEYFIANQYDRIVEDILTMIRGSRDKEEFFDKLNELKKY